MDLACTRTLRASSGDHSMDSTMWCPYPVELRTVRDCTRSGAAAATLVPIMPGAANQEYRSAVSEVQDQVCKRPIEYATAPSPWDPHAPLSKMTRPLW